MAKIFFFAVQHMKVAGHLCGDRSQQFLDGDFSFIEEVYLMGIDRIQINATKDVNINLNHTSIYQARIIKCASQFPSIEFILQYNEKTRLIWDGVLLHPPVLDNIVALVDASCGTGKMLTELPDLRTVFPHLTSFGYAGGIGPDSIDEVLQMVSRVLSSQEETSKTGQ